MKDLKDEKISLQEELINFYEAKLSMGEIHSAFDHIVKIASITAQIEQSGKAEEQARLYQCPYDKATKCNLKDCCLECETFGEYLSKSAQEQASCIKKDYFKPDEDGAM